MVSCQLTVVISLRPRVPLAINVFFYTPCSIPGMISSAMNITPPQFIPILQKEATDDDAGTRRRGDAEIYV